jgi:RNA polymerase sigma-70 factor, ECF subfamily
VAWADESAFAAFYDRTARALWAYVYRATRSAADADDIVQEAFCRIIGAEIEQLAEEDRRRYLFRIAGNLITDRWRRSAREQSWQAWFGRTMRRNVIPQEPSGVAASFDRLKPRERALLWLAYVEQQDHQEIATALSLSRGSVKVLLSRARGRLRDLLAANGMIGSSRG